MDTPIAIVCKETAAVVREGVLRYLEKVQYPAKLITIFASSENYAIEYKKVLPSVLFNSIVVGNPSEYYKEGEVIVQVSETLKDIVSNLLTFNQIILYAKELLQKEQASLFGVLPTIETKYHSNTYSTELSMIPELFIVVKNDKSIVLSTSKKTDHERCILHFLKRGKVIRYKGAGVDYKTKNCSKSIEEMSLINKKYPDYTLLGRLSGVPELFLHPRGSPG